MATVAINTTLFTRPDTDRTWTLPASMVDTGKHIISAVRIKEYPENMLASAYHCIASSISRSHNYGWYSLPPKDHDIYPFFENTSAFLDALRPVTNTRFLKAAENYVFKTYKVRLDNYARNDISALATRHAQSVSDRTVDYTTAFDWTPGDFGDNGSCYWNPSYFNHSRVKVLPRLGAMAIRSWDKHGEGDGRAWVIPVPRRLSGETPAFQVMNAYGAFKDLQPHPAFILARHLTDVTGVDWHVPADAHLRVDDAYCNGDSKIVMPTAAAMPPLWTDRYDRPSIFASDVDLPRPAWAINDRHARVRCTECDEYFAADDLDGDNLCEDCAQERREENERVTCCACGERTHYDNCYTIDEGDDYYCEDCYNEHCVYIERIERETHRDNVIWIEVDGVDMPYMHDEHGDTWTVCEVTMTPILIEDSAEIEDADEMVYTVNADFVTTHCTPIDGHDFPVLVTPLDNYVPFSRYDNRALWNALNYSECSRLASLTEPRALHWLDLPADYVAPAAPDNLTIPMEFVAA